MNSEKISVFEQTKSVLPIYYTYASLGAIATLCNAIVVVVYVCHKKLRRRLPMFIGLAMADLINGLAFLITGIKRTTTLYSLQDVYEMPTIPRATCAADPGNILMVIGSQWPALITLAFGIERYCAVKFPVKYLLSKHKLYNASLISTLSLCLCSLGIALYLNLVVNGHLPSNFACNMSLAYGFAYTTFNYLFTSLGHTIGFLLSCFALNAMRRRVHFAKGIQVRKEYRLAKVIFAVSAASLIMVVLPNMFLYAARFFPLLSYDLLGWTYCFFMLRSAFNLCVLGFGVRQFRQQMTRITCCLKGNSQNVTSAIVSKSDANSVTTTPVKFIGPPTAFERSPTRHTLVRIKIDSK